MTPDTCPHCGAPLDGSNGWACGTFQSFDRIRWWPVQSHECARYVRTRISQLRRMLSSIPGAIERAKWIQAESEEEYDRKKWRRIGTFQRFAGSVRREIDRLRGGA